MLHVGQIKVHFLAAGYERIADLNENVFRAFYRAAGFLYFFFFVASRWDAAANLFEKTERSDLLTDSSNNILYFIDRRIRVGFVIFRSLDPSSVSSSATFSGSWLAVVSTSRFDCFIFRN